jgi:N-acetylglucosaminyl-diphospho-decaprenol L-rhamnosyltransferase
MTEGRRSSCPPTDLRAVIVTHDRADTALACVEAASREVDPSRIVVVVNHPGGAAAADLARLQESVGAVGLNRRRAGYGANVNAGARQLSEDLGYLLFLNDDAFVQDGAISVLRCALERQPNVGLVGPQLVDDNGRPLPSRHRFPTLASELIGALIVPAAIASRLGRRYDDPAPPHVEAGDVWPSGAALLVRAAAFREVGGFDEGYFLYSEELDRLAGRYVLHHLDLDAAVPAIARILAPGGIAAFVETMATNHVLRLARRLLVGRLGVPRYGTDDERPLGKPDLRALSGAVGPLRVEVAEMHFLRILDRQVLRYRSRALSQVLGKLDDALLALGLTAASITRCSS